MTAEFITSLQKIVGSKYVLTGEGATKRFRTGFRFGGGGALCVVQPGSLVEQWRVVKACVAANKIVILQAANTGLTGGSTPYGAYDREIVIINTMRLTGIRLIREGKQVIAFPGATLDTLERMLKPLGREPHSVIGSSCIGASIAGGIANNSGGALVRRGPAYTQLALFARLHDSGQLDLVNHLGITLQGEPEEILARMDRGDYSEDDIQDNAGLASDNEYAQHVRQIDADTPARFNADPRRLFEASGCAGKVVLFAARLDTFPSEGAHKLFYIGTNDTKQLAALRRHILSAFEHLPVAGEYIHKDAFDVAERYGKDTFLVIRFLGTRFLSKLFALKGKFDTWFGARASDRMLQIFSKLFPGHLPRRMKEFRRKFDHHLLLQVTSTGADEARSYLAAHYKDNYFEATDEEMRRALLHRFAVAGAGVRYRAVHKRDVEDIIAVDIALRRNDTDWFEELPQDIRDQCVAVLYCGHFLCHVFHQDYILKRGADAAAIKQKLFALIDARGAEYPAEHNVGHFYKAKPVLKTFYQQLDPCNAFNPGVGQTAKKHRWAE